METWVWIVLIVVGFILGGVAGFFISQWYFKRYLKKNPPVTESMIRAMMTQMGRKPSEKQVRQVMQSMQNAK
jgi:uncharacterized protein YneF (UPF0154 family)